MVKSFLGQSNIHVLLDIFIATSHDLGVPLNPVESSLSGRVCMDMPNSMKFHFSKGCGCLFFPFSFFSVLKFFLFFVSYFEWRRNRNVVKTREKRSKTFLVRITRAISTSVICKREMLKRYSFLTIQEQENSRVDIIEPTKILEHAIAETHVISWFTTKKPILFRLRPQRASACLPCHVPMVPGRGEGSWAGITPIADWSRFEQTQRRGHWWRTEIGQRQLRFEGRRNVIAVSRS